jgi:membrane fusion protein, multidrug efflux system
MSHALSSVRGSIAAIVLLGSVLVTGAGLALWKYSDLAAEERAAASQPEPTEAVTAAVATARDYRRTTTSIGTVLALRSITLQNELSGTVRQVKLVPGQIVEAGAVLVALDVSVEQAELEAQEAQAALAKTTLDRLQGLREHRATSQEEVDQARAARDVALANMERTRAVIAKKIIRAPFRALVGIADVHPGQYLTEGTKLTTLQGVADAAHVDFTVAQRVASGLRIGDSVAVTGSDSTPIPARIVAVDSRVDPTTRNAMVRARITGSVNPSPGASVRVEVPVGGESQAVAVPVSALRKGPQGDHVFVIAADSTGKTRAHLRPVRSGPVLGDSVLLLSGVAVGERVASSGSFKLRESALVSVADPSASKSTEAK